MTEDKKSPGARISGNCRQTCPPRSGPPYPWTMTNARDTIDWEYAARENREALSRIVALLFSLAGLDEKDRVDTLPRRLRSYILRILRPAESALRRLIVIAARDMKVELSASPLSGDRRVASVARQTPVRVNAAESAGTPPPPGSAAPSAPRPPCFSDIPTRARLGGKRSAPAPGPSSVPGAGRVPAFPLLDSLKRFDSGPVRRPRPASGPRIRSLSAVSLPVYMRSPEPPPRRLPMPDDRVSAVRLCRRLAALKHALGDLDAQARRLARWRARREAGLLRFRRATPMRPGRPPGFRKRRPHEIDDIVIALDGLARLAWDSS